MSDAKRMHALMIGQPHMADRVAEAAALPKPAKAKAKPKPKPEPAAAAEPAKIIRRHRRRAS